MPSHKSTLLLAAAMVVTLANRDAAQSTDSTKTSTTAGVYSDAQATRGKEVYETSCQSCHTPASHTGPEFTSSWDGKMLGELVKYVTESMPKNDPGSFSQQQYLDVIAYLLKLNGMPAGSADLPADTTALGKIRFEVPKKGL